MASSIVVPDLDKVTNYGPAMAKALIDVAAAAKADIDGNVAASLSDLDPADVGAVADPGVGLDASREDHVHADPMRGAAGTALTDADATIQVGGGNWRVLPAATLSTNRQLTLGTTSAVAGDQIELTRLDLTANTYTIINGGAGAGTLLVFPVSKLGCAKFQFDGTNWALRSFGMQP